VTFNRKTVLLCGAITLTDFHIYSRICLIAFSYWYLDCNGQNEEAKESERLPESETESWSKIEAGK
jgi:hypothetical protein